MPPTRLRHSPVSKGNHMRVTVLLLLAAVVAQAQGIRVQPGADGAFVYSDDYETDRFLREAFCDGVDETMWVAGDIRLYGKQRHRSLIYRFHGDHTIRHAEVTVAQMANKRHLGGTNSLYVSGNGLDWMKVTDTGSQPEGGHAWRSQPLRFAGTPPDAAELWVRIEMDNNSGIKSNASNFIKQMDVRLELAGAVEPADDPGAATRQAWTEAVRRNGGPPTAIDADVPSGQGPPFYLEDVDGLLVPGTTMTVRRALGSDDRLPLALAGFVETRAHGDPVVVRIGLRCTRDSSRSVTVCWDGREVRRFDAGSFIEVDRAVPVVIGGPHEPGVHTLRVGGEDSGSLGLTRIEVAGAAQPRWVGRPAQPEGARLEVVSAVYQPDPAPPADSQAVEGRRHKQQDGLVHHHLQQLYAEHADFGSIRTVVRNAGTAPVELVGELELNGRPISEHYVDFKASAWDERGVVWHRIRPRLLDPGDCAEVYVRFRRRLEGDVLKLRVPARGAPAVDVDIPVTGPGLTVDYVVVRDDTLYIYARRAGPTGRVEEFSLDGAPLRAPRIAGADFPGSVALCVAKPATPLRQGSYHVAGVRTTDGRRVDAQFRVLPFFFPRTAIHIPPERCADLRMNMQMWYAKPLATCKEHDIYTVSQRIFDQHERVRFVLGPDEPDAHDNRGGGYDRGLGYHARRLMRIGWQPLIERFTPQAASWIIMNGTTRPLNWAVYGKLADVACFDPYPINFYGADHAMVRETLGYARLCGAPHPMVACLEAFGFSKGQGVPANRRCPTPAEWRQNVVQAVGSGMKGLTSWTWLNIAGGFQLSDEFQEEVAAVNQMLEHIETELLLATPVELAESDAGSVMTGVVGRADWRKERVWVRALLAGPDTILIAAANHIPAAKPEPPVIEPAQNVTVTVRLPPYLPEVDAFEVTTAGRVPYAVQCTGSVARLRIASIESGRLFLLTRTR